jgi:hypothetical protein
MPSMRLVAVKVGCVSGAEVRTAKCTVGGTVYIYTLLAEHAHVFHIHILRCICIYVCGVCDPTGGGRARGQRTFAYAPPAFTVDDCTRASSVACHYAMHV